MARSSKRLMVSNHAVGACTSTMLLTTRMMTAAAVNGRSSTATVIASDRSCWTHNDALRRIRISITASPAHRRSQVRSRGPRSAM